MVSPTTGVLLLRNLPPSRPPRRRNRISRHAFHRPCIQHFRGPPRHDLRTSASRWAVRTDRLPVRSSPAQAFFRHAQGAEQEPSQQWAIRRNVHRGIGTDLTSFPIACIDDGLYKGPKKGALARISLNGPGQIWRIVEHQHAAALRNALLVQGVEGLASLGSNIHQSGLPQEGQVMRYRGLGDLQPLGQFTNRQPLAAT